MAEIRVRPQRRSRAWLWVLIALLVVALVAWYAVSHGLIRVRTERTGAGPASVPSLHSWS